VAGYTKLNLNDDVEDSAKKFGMSDVLEAHFAREDIEAKEFGLSLQRIKPNVRLPFGHSHNKQEEVYVVVSGSARIKLGDDIVELGQWDMVRIAPGVWRGVEGGPDGTELIAFGAPNTENKDAEMQPGWWPEGG
jgi:mannose-6-phosphate isomerase-like protein (cupin superfamily)